VAVKAASSRFTKNGALSIVVLSGGMALNGNAFGQAASRDRRISLCKINL
jgi:hypothetical protein